MRIPIRQSGGKEDKVGEVPLHKNVRRNGLVGVFGPGREDDTRTAIAVVCQGGEERRSHRQSGNGENAHGDRAWDARLPAGDERSLRKRAQFGFGAQGGHGRKAIGLLQKEVHVIRFGHTRRAGLHLLRQRGVRIAFQPPVEPKRKEVDGVHDEPAIRQMGAFVRGHDDGGGDDRQNRQQSQRHPNHRGLL